MVYKTIPMKNFALIKFYDKKKCSHERKPSFIKELVNFFAHILMYIVGFLTKLQLILLKNNEYNLQVTLLHKTF